MNLYVQPFETDISPCLLIKNSSFMWFGPTLEKCGKLSLVWDPPNSTFVSQKVMFWNH